MADRVAWMPVEKCPRCREDVTGVIGEETCMGSLGPEDPNRYSVRYGCCCGETWWSVYKGLRGAKPERIHDGSNLAPW